MQYCGSCYSQLTLFEDFWHGLCQMSASRHFKYKFLGVILQVFMQNVCISSLKAQTHLSCVLVTYERRSREK